MDVAQDELNRLLRLGASDRWFDHHRCDRRCASASAPTSTLSPPPPPPPPSSCRRDSYRRHRHRPEAARGDSGAVLSSSPTSTSKSPPRAAACREAFERGMIADDGGSNDSEDSDDSEKDNEEVEGEGEGEDEGEDGRGRGRRRRGRKLRLRSSLSSLSTTKATLLLGGLNSHGDTVLHRMLATHAPARAVGCLLERAAAVAEKADCKRKEGWGRGGGDIDYDDSSCVGVGEGCGEEAEDEAEGTTDDHCHRGQLRRCLRIDRRPSFVGRRNRMGATALHIAVWRNSWHAGDVVELLLHANPEESKEGGEGVTSSLTPTPPPPLSLASIPMRCGAYPLHVACGLPHLTLRSEILRSLLDADPTLAFAEDVNGDNPLSILWKNVLRYRWARSAERGEDGCAGYGGGGGYSGGDNGGHNPHPAFPPALSSSHRRRRA